MTLTFGSLFAGIGGIDLGLERAGLTCAWQVEIDDYATRVLAKHWPNVPRHRDVRLVGAHNLPAVDVLAGGFPCQPHSEAGKRRAGADDRDLWPEFVRLIRALKPRWVLAENVRGLLSSDDRRYFGTILRDLAGSGYDAEWSIVSACALGAPHTRERVLILAHSRCVSCERGLVPAHSAPQGDDGIAAERKEDRKVSQVGTKVDSRIRSLAEWWRIEPAVSRMAHGVPARVDRLRGLGNAVVPQVAEFVGRLIVAQRCLDVYGEAGG